ncbi:hypothetical protein B0T21DRAFT_346146 [Apiosordaria backusii]|uniref:Uncharacterized protein n=1 Tax=Apiosordaria backusii TaxID=314023 RepID=A0AA40K1A4_9PEZI|nr:hypothetical protein B0T21DRAFT_346146 [Apiosordaria backusii]
MKSLLLTFFSLTGAYAAVAAEASQAATADVASEALALSSFKDAVWSVEALPSPPRGPGYKPLIPDSYVGCVFDPTGPFGQLDFTYLTPNGLAVVRDWRTNRAVEETDPDDKVPGLFFEPPNNVFSPRGVFDVRLPGTNGRPDRYLAVFKNGEVGWVLRSTNGQTALRDERGEPYVTTIFSLQCNGLSTAGIIGGLEFEFAVKDGKLYARGIPPTKKHSHILSKRQEEIGTESIGNVEEQAAALRGPTRGGDDDSKKKKIPSITVGLYVLPRIQEIPISKTCPVGSTLTTRDPPVPVTSNGCGPFDWWRWYFVPKLHETFEDACNWVDVCWTDCSQTYKSCNDGFYSRLLDRCNAKFRTEASLASCRNLAKAYLHWYSIPQAVILWEFVVDQHCTCKCDKPDLSLCNDRCVDYRTDPKNCGSCGNVCATGNCINGACASSCTDPWSCFRSGASCGSYPIEPVGTGNCMCWPTAGGEGNVCIQQDTQCTSIRCASNEDCDLGWVCAVGGCCGTTCIPLQRDVCANPAVVGELLRSTPDVSRTGERLTNA